MDLYNTIFTSDEKAVFALRQLYGGMGYSHFKMSKFEEYDLYVQNKDFLISDNIITFTDTNGKLMALKPDVTLSIIKSSLAEKGESVKKVYYNENVYRVSGKTGSFKEIMQVGLECIGDLGDYNIYEVLMLAAKSLACISEDFILDVSHIDIISAVISALGVGASREALLMKHVSEKNAHSARAVCLEAGVDSTSLERLISSYGDASVVIPVLRDIVPAEKMYLVDNLESIVTSLEAAGFGGRVKLDFSVAGNAGYYNGFVFTGFINGLPSAILSGGQYDKLMKKMNSSARAIGFALYLDLLERFEEENYFDVDVLLVYSEGDSIAEIDSAVSRLTADGKTTFAAKDIPAKLRYKEMMRLTDMEG